MIHAFLFTFVLGMLFIPAFELLAKYADWWAYVDTEKMFLNTPYYIILGEGLICSVLPFLFRAQLRKPTSFSFVAGILIGLWIFISYFVAYHLVG